MREITSGFLEFLKRVEGVEATTSSAGGWRKFGLRQLFLIPLSFLKSSWRSQGYDIPYGTTHSKQYRDRLQITVFILVPPVVPGVRPAAQRAVCSWIPCRNLFFGVDSSAQELKEHWQRLLVQKLRIPYLHKEQGTNIPRHITKTPHIFNITRLGRH